MNADGSHPRNVTSHPARDDHCTWHPDGRRLLFVSDRDGGSDLYLGEVPAQTAVKDSIKSASRPCKGRTA